MNGIGRNQTTDFASELLKRGHKRLRLPFPSLTGCGPSIVDMKTVLFLREIDNSQWRLVLKRPRLGSIEMPRRDSRAIA